MILKLKEIKKLCKTKIVYKHISYPDSDSNIARNIINISEHVWSIIDIYIRIKPPCARSGLMRSAIDAYVWWCFCVSKNVEKKKKKRVSMNKVDIYM